MISKLRLTGNDSVKNSIFFIKLKCSNQNVSKKVILVSLYLNLNPLLSGNPKRGTQANSADPDQMPLNAASDQSLHCLLTAIFV